MPDNRSVSIYRNNYSEPENFLFSTAKVEGRASNGIPVQISFTTEDGREGDIYINASDVDAVIVSPAGILDQ